MSSSPEISPILHHEYDYRAYLISLVTRLSPLTPEHTEMVKRMLLDATALSIIGRALKVYHTDFPDEFATVTDREARMVYGTRTRTEMSMVFLYRVLREFHMASTEERYRHYDASIKHTLACLSYIAESQTGGKLYYSAEIGEGLTVVHPQGLIVGSRVVVGRRCRLYQGVTIGDRYKSNRKPVLGDDVTVYANATILGDVRIGDRVVVGAGTLVVRDVEQDCSVRNKVKLVSRARG